MEHLHIHYNIGTVLLSFLIAVLASYSALNLAGKISRSRGTGRTIWLLAGSCVMGCGVWSMHFVGMLASKMTVSVQYDITITILSAFASIFASYIAFHITSKPHVSFWSLALGGFFMGSGIVAMHYIGMAAVRTSATLQYDPFLWTLSALIALATSYVALFLFRKFRNSPDFSRWKLYCSIVMGIAICGMHYTGMAASRFYHQGGMQAGQDGASPENFLLVGVLIATFFILAVSWVAIFLDRNVLERMAYTDPLTGLPNRHGLGRFFEESFPAVSGGAVLFIDLDRFKAINDTLGHDIGDLLLQEVAGRLLACIGDKQSVFRLGGDEFLIASTEGGEDSSHALAKHILQEVKKAYKIEDNELYITASIGISLAPEHGVDRSSLMKAADTAMYNSKGTGKNKYCLFNEEMGRNLVRKLELERDLRKALHQQEFRVVYQPKWDSVSDRMVGMESLLRWDHPRLGTIAPKEFIPISEETGVIVPITHWMLKEVCLQNQIWQQQGLVRLAVSVNLSIRLFESQTLLDMVKEALEVSGMEAQYLELEITESVAMQDVEDTSAQLRSLRQLGIRIALDDFGTGYSSLGSLDEVPVDTLKIDQSFIRRYELSSKQAIISSIIAIASNLNLEVIAEGVETEQQMEFLKSRGCHVMQGFYYGKPMPAVEISRMLEQSVSERIANTLMYEGGR